MNEYGMLRMNRKKIQPSTTYVRNQHACFMFVSTYDKHVLEKGQTVHYRTSVAKQHV
jgi:hypothetical protein